MCDYKSDSKYSDMCDMGNLRNASHLRIAKLAKNAYPRRDDQRRSRMTGPVLVVPAQAVQHKVLVLQHRWRLDDGIFAAGSAQQVTLG